MNIGIKQKVLWISTLIVAFALRSKKKMVFNRWSLGPTLSQATPAILLEWRHIVKMENKPQFCSVYRLTKQNNKRSWGDFTMNYESFWREFWYIYIHMRDIVRYVLKYVSIGTFLWSFFLYIFCANVNSPYIIRVT